MISPLHRLQVLSPVKALHHSVTGAACQLVEGGV